MLAHLSTYYIPRQDSPDSDFFRWAFAWTPWALTHGRSPLFSDVVFAPTGASLTWVTISPGPALAAWPITRAFGPLAAYNVLVLLAPPLAAWAAYLLCRRLTDRFLPSLAAGFLYGFSSYMAIQFNHPNMALLFPIPLAIYLFVRRLEGSIRPIPFVVGLTATMLALWSISIELFATATLFGGIALVLALALAGEDRARLLRATLLVGIGYVVVAAVVFVPYLLPTLQHAPPGLMHNPERRYNDLLRFVLPRDRQLVGGDALCPSPASTPMRRRGERRSWASGCSRWSSGSRSPSAGARRPGRCWGSSSSARSCRLARPCTWRVRNASPCPARSSATCRYCSRRCRGGSSPTPTWRWR